MGNTCKPMAVSFQCMTKFTTNKKKKRFTFKRKVGKGYFWKGKRNTKKAPGIKVKEESEKTGLKVNIQKTKNMASGPITSWQIDGETMETVTDCIFLGSKITADSECSHEI